MKRFLMRYFIVIAAIVVIFDLRFVNVAYANTDEAMGDMSYKELMIQLMPEYVIPPGWTEEGPVVLFVQNGLFVNEGDEAFEGTFSVPVPLDDPTFTIGYVGQTEDGEVIDQEFTINEEEQRVEWVANQPIQPGEEYVFVVEYYSAPFGSENNRAFSYEHMVDTEIESLKILFFEPMEAENVQLSEEATNVMDMFGALVHEFEFQNVTAGDAFELDISYEKDSTTTTMEALEQQMPPDDEVHQGMGQGGSTGANTGGPIISNESAIMISVSIIIAGVFVFLGLRNRQKNPKNTKVVSKESSSVVKTEKNPKQKDFAEEKKRLRQQLIDGQIDEETYRKKLSKLS